MRCVTYDSFLEASLRFFIKKFIDRSHIGCRVTLGVTLWYDTSLDGILITKVRVCSVLIGSWNQNIGSWVYNITLWRVRMGTCSMFSSSRRAVRVLGRGSRWGLFCARTARES